MKHKVSILTILLMVLAIPQNVMAYDFSAVAPSGQTLYYNIVGGNAQVTYFQSYSSLSGSLVIPDVVTYNGITYSVTSINDNSFHACSELTTVIIPNSVTSIGNHAFSNCSGLTSIIIGNSVTNIGNYAFYACSGLTSVSIPNSVTSIGSDAFGSCSNLNSITIGNSVTSIDYGAFRGCSELTYVTIPNSVISIGPLAFYNCTRLASVNIPEQVNSIGQNAFYNVRHIFYHGNATGSPWGALHLNGVTEGDFIYSDSTKTALWSYIGSNEAITIPVTVTSIGDRAFFGCSWLDSVTMGNSVTSIGERAFQDCNGLTSVIIGDSVTSIGDIAFADCWGLTSVTIPNSVTSIGFMAFYRCSGLTTVNYNATNCTSMGSSYLPVFSNCTNMTTLNIGRHVTQIPDYGFYGCSELTEITSLASVAPTLGTDVFYDVSSIILVTIPCGSLMSYNSQWDYFSNLIEADGYTFDATTSDSTMGIVIILTEPTCQDPTAVVNAASNTGYHFTHWNDGNTDNPRTLMVSSDSTIIAYFTANGGTEGIDNAYQDAIHVLVKDGRIIVDGVKSEDVQVFDIMGRQTKNDMLPNGVYLVKVGNHPARKVVVIR